MKIALFALCCFVQAIYGRSDMSFRIVGGKDADIGIAPYVCALKIIKENNRQKICGCSILSKRWVLTAAHCIKGAGDAKKSKILVGSNELRKNATAKNESTRKHYKVEQWITHQNYGAKYYVDDIALVQVKEDIQFNEGVQPIKFSAKNATVGANVRITGWGFTSGNEKQRANVLQALNMTIVPVDECKKKWKYIDENHLCTISKNGTTCKGDLGNPLVLNNEVVGVASARESGCPVGKPNVFTRVSSYFNWITKQIGPV